MSCPALAKQLAPSKWLCTAEGASSYGYNLDTSIPGDGDTRDVFMMGTGPTRDAASYQAIRDCNAILTFNLNIERTMSSEPSWSAEVTSRCHITQCIAPSR